MNARELAAIIAAKVHRNRPAVFPPDAPPLYRIRARAGGFEHATRSANLAEMYRAIGGFDVQRTRPRD